MEIWFLKAHDANKILHVNFNNCLTVKSVALYKNVQKNKTKRRKGKNFKKNIAGKRDSNGGN